MTETPISERLREGANGIGSLKTERGDYGLCDEAADTIDALVAALERIRDGGRGAISAEEKVHIAMAALTLARGGKNG